MFFEIIDKVTSYCFCLLLIFRQIEVVINLEILSEELQEMEMNQLISRTVYEAKPIAVEYAITEYGMTLEKVLMEMADWGKKHKRRLITEGHGPEATAKSGVFRQ